MLSEKLEGSEEMNLKLVNQLRKEQDEVIRINENQKVNELKTKE